MQSPLHRRSQPRHSILEQVVRRAAFHTFHHCFFARRAGKNDEGDIQAAFLQQFQRAQRAEPGQHIIRKDDVGLDLELAAVLLFRVHAPALRVNTGTL